MEGGIQKHLEEWQILALLFAATIHDYDHPGTNNNFEIARFTTKALTYNDQVAW
jgi:calcium/calmodulin-dependent 3',5'-cyclic nucleotide phosphodiesterase